jgi:Pyridoxamine 5'-phosphate oxidase
MAVPTIGLASGHASAEIPASHRDLVDCPPVAALTTVMADGYPQTSVVWCDFDGEYVRVNTMRGFAKERNMRRDPRVTLLCYGRPALGSRSSASQRSAGPVKRRDGWLARLRLRRT